MASSFEARAGSPEHGVLGTTSELMSLQAFYGIVWAGFALCTLAFIGHLWFRWASLRKILAEDYLMAFVLCLQLATAVICQLRLHFVYTMEDVGNGLRLPPPTFLEDVPKGLRGLLAAQILTILGLWGVKFSFLLFFRRIFCATRPLYRYIWWGVVVVTVLCLGVMFGLLSYECVASDVEVIMSTCTLPPAIRLEWIQVQTTCAVDAFSDALIMVFPVAILWKVRISLRKKLYLSALFMLSLFTVAMAIIRGTISYGRVASDYTQSQNISWIWFWLQFEFIVSFLVACLVSFRGLFTQKKKPNVKPQQENQDKLRTIGRPLPKKKGWHLYNSILDTCNEDLEGTTNVDFSRDTRADGRSGSEDQFVWLDLERTQTRQHSHSNSVQTVHKATKQQPISVKTACGPLHD